MLKYIASCGCSSYAVVGHRHWPDNAENSAASDSGMPNQKLIDTVKLREAELQKK